jgi:hypothetical protein
MATLQIGSHQAYHQGNVVGTVAQTGGVPTGTVIEQGSNANGEYVKYASGAQVCWGSFSENRVAIGVLASTVTFPVSFSAAPEGLAGMGVISSIVANIDHPPSCSGITTTAMNVNAHRSTTANSTLRWIAIGRWY